MKINETNKAILKIMPDSQELSKHSWHRLAKVLWLISAFPLILYFYFCTEEGFSFRLEDFVGILVFSYFTVPIIYRVLLYIFTGSTRGEKIKQ